MQALPTRIIQIDETTTRQQLLSLLLLDLDLHLDLHLDLLLHLQVEHPWKTFLEKVPFRMSSRLFNAKNPPMCPAAVKERYFPKKGQQLSRTNVMGIYGIIQEETLVVPSKK
jgi:hypothetical protein